MYLLTTTDGLIEKHHIITDYYAEDVPGIKALLVQYFIDYRDYDEENIRNIEVDLQKQTVTFELDYYSSGVFDKMTFNLLKLENIE